MFGCFYNVSKYTPTFVFDVCLLNLLGIHKLFIWIGPGTLSETFHSLIICQYLLLDDQEYTIVL